MGQPSRDWKKLIDQQSACGQSVTEFCRERGLHATDFYKRRRRLLKQDGDHASPSTRKTSRSAPAEKNFDSKFIEVISSESSRAEPNLRLTSRSGITVEVYL